MTRYVPRADTAPTVEDETLHYPWEPFLELLELARAELVDAEGEFGKELAEAFSERDNVPKAR